MSREPLALYVHWPFCVSKCPYCDFNSHVRSSIDQDTWREALLADLKHEAALLADRRLTSIFFGGGTPSLMDPATVEAIIRAATDYWQPANDIEITLEANPNSVEAARFAAMVRRREFEPLGPDAAADLYELTDAMTSAAGIPAYEISNHARGGQESRHNLTYWRYGDYAGIGPGAHGRRLGMRTVRHRKPENFLSCVSHHGHGIAEEAALSAVEAADEMLVMGLRLSEGVDAGAIADRFGFESVADWDRVERLVGSGHIVRNGTHIRLTSAGRLLLDHILGEIAAVQPRALAVAS